MGMFTQVRCPLCHRTASPRTWENLNSGPVGRCSLGLIQFSGGRGSITTLGEIQSLDENPEVARTFREIVAPRTGALLGRFVEEGLVAPHEVAAAVPGVEGCSPWAVEFEYDEGPEREETEEVSKNVTL